MDRVKILIVEDEKIMAQRIKMDLENNDYQVVGAVLSGKDAIDQVEEQQVDLVLMDVHLKGDMDGIEAAGIIRNRFGIPVIFLTSFSDEDTILRAKLTEPSGYLIKEPFEIVNKSFVENKLYSNIEITLYRQRMEKRLREHERWLNAVLNSISDAVIATDSSKQVKFMNTPAEDLTGWIEADAIGMNLDEVFNIFNTESTLKKFSLDNTVPIEKAMLITSDQSQILIEGSITPIKDEDENIEGVVVIFRPVNKE